MRDDTRAGNKGLLINSYRMISSVLIHMGDLNQAAAYVRKIDALLTELNYAPRRFTRCTVSTGKPNTMRQ